VTFKAQETDSPYIFCGKCEETARWRLQLRSWGVNICARLAGVKARARILAVELSVTLPSQFQQRQRRKMDLTQISLQEGAAPPMQDQFHAFINSSGPIQTHYRKASIQKRKRGAPDATSNADTMLEGTHIPSASASTSPSLGNVQLGDGEHKSGSRNTGKGAADGGKKKKANRACCHCQKAHLTCDDCEYNACGTCASG
jgi:hypothetical protein